MVGAFAGRALALAVSMVLAVVLGVPARADIPALTLSPAAHHPLDGRIASLADDGGASIESIARRDDFRPGVPGITTGTLWVRFTVRRPAEAPSGWVLAFGEPDIDDVRVYVPAPGGTFHETRLGRRVPSSLLPLSGLRHMAALELPADEVVTVHVRLGSRHKIRFEQAGLWQEGALMAAEARQAALYGILFGIMGLIVFGYALFGLWLRDAAMLLYAAFVTTSLSRGLTHSGLVTLLFPSVGGTANYLMGGAGMVAGIAAFILMWDRMLDLKVRFPRVHRLYLGAAALMAVPLGAVLSERFSLFVPAVHLVMLATSLGSIVLAALLLKRSPRDHLLKFYLCAFLPMVLAWGVEVAARLWPAVPVDLGRSMDLFATLAHIALLSVALAYRLGRMQEETMQTEVVLAGERLARQRQRTFFDMATHEFKTPLAVIDSAVQMLEMLVQTDRREITDRFAHIRRAVRRLVRLIETCLVVERDTALALDLGPLRPAELVAGVVERNADPDRAALTGSSVDLPDTVLADGGLLGIALDALVDNARRHGPADQPIAVHAQIDGGRLRFTVADHGPGIPPDEAGRIFEKYYRCRASRHGVPGTGIGLHLVKTVAELHGGEAAYRPREGGGALFTLAIPLQPPAHG